MRVEIGGIKFDSKLEAARYQELLLLERANKISNLSPHPVFTLTVNDIKICSYESDAEYYEDGKWIVEDSKSAATLTALSKVKMALFKALFPEASLRIHGLRKR